MNTNTQQSGGRTALKIIGFIFSKIGSFIATFLMVGIITGCLVACALTVFVLQSIDAEEPVTLDSAELGYTSVIYATDENGNEVEVKKLYIADNNRVPIENLEDISPYVVKAVIAIEDRRFREHNGVDWVRTTGSFINMFVPIYPSKSGGSTIHQQLVKNITKDDAIRIDRKVREIFRALNLAQNYSKDQVMLSYLNVVPFGAGTNGIEAAANTYFDKSAKDLTLAESAAIVGITKYPTAYNPLFYPVANKERQRDVLYFMNLHGEITDEEYEAALEEKLVFQPSEEMTKVLDPTSYFDDYVMECVVTDLMEKKGFATRAEAVNDFYMGGYKIYTTQIIKEQKRLEEFYLSESNFPPIARAEYPQSGAVITTHNGAIIAMVGGTGPKTGSRSFNRVTMAKRQPGSTFKPIGPYALAFEYDLLTPSTLISDSPINPDAPQSEWYPKNYYGEYLGNVTVERAIKSSINTVAVKVTQMVTPASLFDFYYYDLNMTSLVDPTDIDIAPMALGGLTEGVTPLELVGAYQILVNGGYYTKPYAYTHVTDSRDHIVLKTDTSARPVISEDTSVLLNKMTQVVVKSGTGTAAQIPNMPTGGKTGTSNDDVDQWFVGFTPYYIANVWLGYDEPQTYDKFGNQIPNSVFYSPNPYPTPPLFKSIMEPLHEGLEAKPFLESENVISQIYCADTGNLASVVCTNTATTWYKKSNLPPVCNGVHGGGEETNPDEDGGDDGEAVTSGGDRPSDVVRVDSGSSIDSSLHDDNTVEFAEDTLDS